MKTKIDCQQCGICCTVFDISSLNKPEGMLCNHLTSEHKCNNYNNRPNVCRDYVPDEVCILISTLNFEDRVKVVQRTYGLESKIATIEKK